MDNDVLNCFQYSYSNFTGVWYWTEFTPLRQIHLPIAGGHFVLWVMWDSDGNHMLVAKEEIKRGR